MNLKHIGLQVVENDIEKFYQNILNFEILRTFNLSENITNEIFEIKEDVKVIYGNCEGIDFELFVSKKIKNSTYNHICIETENATEILEKAKQNGYKTYVRQNNENNTFFITDSNFNTFEIKNIIK